MTWQCLAQEQRTMLTIKSRILLDLILQVHGMEKNGRAVLCFVGDLRHV